MPASERRFWWCGGKAGYGHVVGEIVHMDLQISGRVTALVLFEDALFGPPTGIPPDRGYVVSGFGIPCSLCKNRFDWYPSLESLNKLLERYKA